MQVGHVTIRLYGDLAGLAPDADGDGSVRVPVGRRRSVKDALEATGVPHTEVDLLVVDGAVVGFSAQVGPGDRVAAYPPLDTLEVESPIRPAPLAEPRFILDVHLGRLAGRLRLLGLDAAYRNDSGDAELARRAAEGPRWLLTRDRGLLMRAVVTHGYLVRATDPDEQVLEVARRFQLAPHLRPFRRCAHCNGWLEAVEKSAIADRLEPGTRRDHDEFRRCADCGQLYWPGSHLPSIQALLERVRDAGARR